MYKKNGKVLSEIGSILELTCKILRDF